MKRDDSLWKAILEDIFDDFLYFFIPDADQLFDFQKGFIFLDKELNQLFPPEKDDFQPRYVDKLVKVFTREGQEEWILIHIEVQGYRDNLFPQRMYQYYARIFDKYQKPITAFAILTDANRQFKPSAYERSYLGTTLLYRYNVYKVLEQDMTVLDAASNPFAVVIMTVLIALQKKKISEGKLFDLKIELARRLLSKSFSKEKIRVLMNFLRFYVRFDKPESMSKFDEQIDVLTNQRKTMGIEEFLLYRAEKQGEMKGIEKGIEKSNQLVIKNLLLKTDFTSERIADLVGVPVTVVEKMKKKMK